METRNIERFFLNTLLRIVIVGVSIVLVADVGLYPEDQLSIAIDIVILASAVVAFFVRKKYPTVAILIITCIVSAAMFYQCLHVPANTTTSLSILLVVGFIYSVMLKGSLMWVMHGITFMLVQSIFLMQFNDDSLRFSSKLNDVVTVAITYSILYFILSYATAMLKEAYDRLYTNLNSLNAQLEAMVYERTRKIQQQNLALLKYSYANAHHLRGPVARLLGLANISRIDCGLTNTQIIEKMADQALEIDTVVKQINRDLDADKQLDLIPLKQMEHPQPT
jgi:signal transduction histidine kinase